ncbi:MAG: ATP phosphoribosyltransferase [Clostridium sp.]|jgi:ATP phosphoribosyltransferase|nr:ATP phosphoribosyltransferase [Clostridium sp.]
MRYLTIALSKGRLTELSVELFEAIGMDCSELKDSSRKLILEDEKNKIKFFLAKPSDVPTYVEYGAADLGIVGKDTLLEEGRHLYEVLNLGFAACRMVVAGPKEYCGKLDQLTNKRVATKYPKIAREYFEHKRRETIEVIKLNGSVELAPLVGLSEVIVDLVESGRTLKENGLVVLDEIADISARLIVNRVSMKMESERINKIIDGLRKELEKR